MTQAKKDATIAALKEIGRLAIFGALAGLITAALSAVNLLPEAWMQTGATALLTFIGRGVDKYVHKNADISLDGILPF